jgi:hypothetical protein
LSAPRITILRALSGTVPCNAFSSWGIAQRQPISGKRAAKEDGKKADKRGTSRARKSA